MKKQVILISNCCVTIDGRRRTWPVSGLTQVRLILEWNRTVGARLVGVVLVAQELELVDAALVHGPHVCTVDGRWLNYLTTRQ